MVLVRHVSGVYPCAVWFWICWSVKFRIPRSVWFKSFRSDEGGRGTGGRKEVSLAYQAVQNSLACPRRLSE